MPEHVNNWLESYLDGELSAQRLCLVETHLAECSACREELQTLRTLSGLLQEAKPETETISAERFSSQVILQLPRRKPKAQNNSLISLLWWIVPGTLLFAWLFVQTLSLTTNLVNSAEQFGLRGALSEYLVAGPQQALWTATIIDLINGDLGASGRTFLEILAGAEWFTRKVGGQFLWQGTLLLLYWSWMVVWFIRRQRHTLNV